MQKRHILSLCLVICLLFSIGKPGVAAPVSPPPVYFTMINANAPLPLSATAMPFLQGDTIFVPINTLDTLGVVHATFPETLRITLIRDNDVFVEFNLRTGTNSIGGGFSIDAAPIIRNNVTYIPVGDTFSTSELLEHFYLNFRLIHTEPAPIIRLYQDIDALTHEHLEENAERMFGLTTRYNTFLASLFPSPPPPPPPPPLVPLPPVEDDSTPTPPIIERIPGVPTPVALSFIGISDDTGHLLNTLSTARIFAGFFLTEEEIITYPHIVRRLHSDGHQIAIYLQESPAEEFLAANNALFDLVRTRTMFATTAASEVHDAAYALGLILFDAFIHSQIPPAEHLGGSLLIRTDTAENIHILPSALRNGMFEIQHFLANI